MTGSEGGKLVTTDDTAAVELLTALTTKRFTCRAYRPDPVPAATIQGILQIARHAASWCNVQPWQAVITSGESTEAFRRSLLEEVRAHPEVRPDIPFPPGYQGIYKSRRQETGYALYAALGIGRDDHERRTSQSLENFRFFGAPHVAVLTVPDELGPYGLVDCGGFIASFLLAARAHGVDTTPQAALAMQSGFIRRRFGIPDAQKVLCGISFGYADEGHPANSFRTGRAQPEEFARLA